MNPQVALAQIITMLEHLDHDTNPKALDAVWDCMTDEQKYDWLGALPQDMREECVASWEK